MDIARFHTPIAYLIFNRPEKTRQTFAKIRELRPAQLFIIADGPRTSEEKRLCDETRAITEQIDWECETKRCYAQVNMGVKNRPPSGISWVFEHVEQVIILEDDCLPEMDFFYFCEEMLDRYKNDDRVMHISGDNFQQHNKDFSPIASYYFSVIPHLWGWATWRRAWELYDSTMCLWPEAQKYHWLADAFRDGAVLDRWEYVLRRYWSGEINSWDGPWVFACLINRGLCINPTLNLISNIGFGRDAAHPTDTDESAVLPSHPLPKPFRHPAVVLPDARADAYTFKYVLGINRHLKQRILWFAKLHFPRVHSLLKHLK